ncbi:MAG: YsnF/AvaK domain-containing protein [Catalinimonas sp.]
MSAATHRPAASPSDSARSIVETETVPVIEERLHVEKKSVEQGRVRITKEVKTEDVELNVPLQHTEVDIERVPVDRYVDEIPVSRYEGDVLIVPVLREVVVKRTLLVEELHIHQRREETQATFRESLREEEVRVEREATTPPQHT